MKTQITIGKLADATGVNIETIRYYERAGLMAAPARTEGNYRVYRMADLTRLQFIKRTRNLGFSLEQVRALLSISGELDQHCGSFDALATKHLADVDSKIADLKVLRRELADAISSCEGGTIAECRILEAFSPQAALSIDRRPPA